MKRCVVLSSNTSWYLYNYRTSTILALQEKGYEVVCLSPLDAYSEKLVQELGARHIPLLMDNQGNNPLRDMLLFARFLSHYIKLRPVVAFHFTIKNNVYGTLAAALLRIPAINNVSGLGTAFIRAGWVSRIVRWLYRVSQPHAFRVFCQNQEDLQVLKDKRLVPVDKLFQLPGSGVNLERFQPLPRSRETSGFRFLYLGRMLQDKGLVELIEAFSALRANYPAELWLAGFSDAKNSSAISEQQLRQWAKLPGVVWLGVTDTPEELLAQIDCLVLPSYREGLPRSLLEANAMAIPAVATDVPGCREVIKHEKNGFLCKPRDTGSLQDALQRMLELTEPERAALGQAGRKLVEEKFDERYVVEMYLQALGEACGH